jgi:hypothetical protein
MLSEEVAKGNYGNILNAIYIILKARVQKCPDHFFQKDISGTIDDLRDTIIKLQNKIIEYVLGVNDI